MQCYRRKPAVLKTGALASLGLGIGGSAVGSAAAQQGEDGDGFGNDETVGDESLFQQDEAMEAVMYREAWVPNGLFTVASPVLQFQPDAPGVSDNVWSDYNSRSIRSTGTNEQVLFFPADDAALGPFDEEFGFVVDDDFVENNQISIDGEPVGDTLDEQELSQLRPTIFITDREPIVFGGDEFLVAVNFSPIPEEEEERIFNRFADDFDFATGGGAGGGGATGTGTPGGTDGTDTPGGATETDTPSG